MMAPHRRPPPLPSSSASLLDGGSVGGSGQKTNLNDADACVSGIVVVSAKGRGGTNDRVRDDGGSGGRRRTMSAGARSKNSAGLGSVSSRSLHHQRCPQRKQNTVRSHSNIALPYWNHADGDKCGQLERRYGGGGNDEDDDEDNDDDGAGTTHHMPLEVGSMMVHNGWMLHCTDTAMAGDDRYALSITYVDGRAELREDNLAEMTTVARDNKELLHMI
jgi:hypothetical protein